MLLGFLQLCDVYFSFKLLILFSIKKLLVVTNV
jgi:hypothetical protein